jgi:hypothetical protein
MAVAGERGKAMQKLDRRSFITAGAAFAALGSFARVTAGQHDHGLYERLNRPGRTGLPDAAAVQHVFDSPAPKAANPGRWVAKAPLPLPRSEMAWAVAHDDKMHLVGGYGAQRVDRPYHQVYKPSATLGSRRRRCPRAPTMSASSCSTACSTPSAVSSSRIAGRTANASPST